MKNQPTPSSSAAPEDRIRALEERNAELEALVSWYNEQFRLLNQQKYGRSSEKTPHPDQTELPLFNEVEVTHTLPTHEETSLPADVSSPSSSSETRQRSTTTPELPVEVKTYTLPENEQACDTCGHAMHVMKTERSRTIEIIPAQVKIIEHRCAVYGCRDCERNGIESTIRKAEKPVSVFPKSMASPSAVTTVILDKYQAGVPLYRQEQLYRQKGVTLSRQTMANWVMYVAENWFTPLVKRMKAALINEPVLHADETVVQVLKEPGRSASSQSYMWLYRTGRWSQKPCVLYDYQTSRAGKHVVRFLHGFDGILHVDGYAGYKSVPRVTLSSCWAHARRYFDQAIKVEPNRESGRPPSLSEQGLHYINALYTIEQEIADHSVEERTRIRREKSLPLMEAYFRWLKEIRPKVAPKSTLGKAVTYSLNLVPSLRVPLEDGRLDLDNNRAERSIKPFVIGRKNWLFSNTMRGAEASATLYSLIETAKENQLNVYAYLHYLLENLPSLDGEEETALDAFLPWSADLPAECRIIQSTE